MFSYDEDGKEVISPKSNLVFPEGEDSVTIYVTAVPKTANYGNSETEAFAYTVDKHDAAAIDVTKAKFKVLNEEGKAAKASYTGAAIYFKGAEPEGAEEVEDTDVNAKLRLVMTVGGKTFRSDVVTDEEKGIYAIGDYFNIQYVNNVRRGTAKVVLTPKAKAKGDVRLQGSVVTKFTITQSSVKDTLKNILAAIGLS